MAMRTAPGFSRRPTEKDPEFYAFYRSMQAYEAPLQPNNTRLVLPPDSRFFRFFGGPSGALRSK